MIDLWVALGLGLVGSLHCAGMCGPLALALPSSGASPASFLAGRFAYNLGRIFTYCAIGLLVGLVGKTLLLVGVQRWVSIGLGAFLIAGLVASRGVVLGKPVFLGVQVLKTRMAGLLRQRSLSALAALGLLNGLLPCGLVYVAAVGAAATGGITQGALYMAAFGLGTLPMMLALSASGKMLPGDLRLKLRKAIPVSIFLLGALLILRGLSLGIPFLSPILVGDSSCCHQ